MKQYYVLFKNHDNGMRLYNSLKSKNIKCTIDIVEIDKNINQNRDKYC